MLGKSQNRSHLLDQARQETMTMLEKAHEMLGIAWRVVTEGDSDGAIDRLDKDINSGERLVRRLVIEHLTLNPEQDLSSSLTLVSIVHDVERLGDYAKSIAELADWSDEGISSEGSGALVREVQQKVEPMFQIAIDSIRDDDEVKASDLMTRHRQIKAYTDRVTQDGLAAGGNPEDVLSVLVGRYLRRVSAHLSNVVSSVVNPFDLIARNE